MAQFEDVVAFDGLIYDALKSNTEGIACKFVRRVELPVDYDLENVDVGLDSPISLGFESWRLLHLEHLPRSKESGFNNIVISSSVAPGRDCGDLGNKIYEVEQHLREADSMNG